MCGSAVFVLYLAVAFVVMPLLGLLMDLGRSLAGGGGGHIRATVINKKGPNAIHVPPAPDLDGRNYPSLAGMKLRSVQDTKEEVMKLHKEMKKARQATGNKVGDALADTLEDLVPEWLHRNDLTADEQGEKVNVGGNAATKAVTVMEDDEEGRIPARENQGGVDEAAADERDANDFDGNPEEGIDAVNIDDDIDEARGDDAVQEPLPQKGNVDKVAKIVKSPVQRDQKTQRADGEIERRQRTLENMDDLPLSSSCPVDFAPDNLSPTLVTQCTLNRVDLLLETCNRWKGPIILSLFLANAEEESAWSNRQSNWEEMCPQITILTHRATAGEHEAGSYPVNKLRNIGLDAVRTSHVFVMDADFVPSADLHGTIGEVLSARHQMEHIESGGAGTSIGQRDAIIVPAFERKPPEPCSSIEDCRKYIKEDSTFIPQSIEDLRNCSRGSKKDCIVFQSDNNWEGHHTTHSDQWLKGDWYDDGDYREAEPDSNTAGDGGMEKKKGRREKMDLSRKIKTVKCFDSLRYEPWVVLRWCPSAAKANAQGSKDNNRPVAPYFDERFHGYGKNKIEMISHLRFLGYTFSILPMSFIIHQPHPESEHKAVWKDVQNEDLHYDMDELYPKFLRELARKYDGGKNAAPTCKKHKQQAKDKKKNEEEEKDGKPKTDKNNARAAAVAAGIHRQIDAYAATANIEKKKKAERIDIQNVEKEDN